MPEKLFRWCFWILVLVGPIIFFSIVFGFAGLLGPWAGVFGAVICTFFVPLVGLVLFKSDKISSKFLTKYSVINFIWIGLIPIQAFAYVIAYDNLGHHVDPATGYVLFYILTTIPMALVGLIVWLICLCCFVKKKEKQTNNTISN